jgi:hypothetical protein
VPSFVTVMSLVMEDIACAWKEPLACLPFPLVWCCTLGMGDEILATFPEPILHTLQHWSWKENVYLKLWYSPTTQKTTAWSVTTVKTPTFIYTHKLDIDLTFIKYHVIILWLNNGRWRIKMSLCLIKHHAMRTYGEADVWLHAFLYSALWASSLPA